MADIQLEKIVKNYGAFEAVKGIDLEVRDGEFVAFVGPSGCGKSTLLRMIAGLEEITGGALRIGGTLVNDTEPKDRDIAMVFQDYALYPHMSVADNIGFGLRMRGMSATERRERVEEAAAILQITQLLDRKPGQLSGGSASVWPWVGRLSADRRCSCSTNLFQTWMPSCVSTCEPRSNGCTAC